MNTETKKYRKSEFKKIETEYSEYKPMIKIIKPDSETKWLKITEKEMQKIITILTK